MTSPGPNGTAPRNLGPRNNRAARHCIPVTFAVRAVIVFFFFAVSALRYPATKLSVPTKKIASKSANRKSRTGVALCFFRWWRRRDSRPINATHFTPLRWVIENQHQSVPTTVPEINQSIKCGRRCAEKKTFRWPNDL